MRGVPTAPERPLLIRGQRVRWSTRHGCYLFADGQIAGTVLDTDLGQELVAEGYWGAGFVTEWHRRRYRGPEGTGFDDIVAASSAFGDRARPAR